MSEENRGNHRDARQRQQIEMIQRGYEAFNNHTPAVGSDMHPDFQLDFSRSVGLEGGVYGPDGMTTLFERYWEAFDEIKIEPEEFIEFDEQVVAIVHVRGRGRGSGVEVDARGPHLWSFRDGLVVGFTLFQETPDAVQAARELAASRPPRDE